MQEYKTVAVRGFDTCTEKKSRFIGYCSPVASTEEAGAFINEIKGKHWDASHNVSAFVLRENHVQRYSDDGEPNGTAGMPVLDVLLGEGLVDVCVVVTRYFGGTLLGTGGLHRAYAHSAKLAVQAGQVITMAPCKLFTVSVSYSFFDRLQQLLGQYGAVAEETLFSENVTVHFAVDARRAAMLQKEFIECSNGRFRMQETGEKFARV